HLQRQADRAHHAQSEFPARRRPDPRRQRRDPAAPVDHPGTLAMRASRSRGFTLVEVLVALVIMAIMSLMAWEGVDGIVRARDANQVRLEQTLRLETVIAQWEQDLASLQESAAAAEPGGDASH